jgi:hypothetical protein
VLHANPHLDLVHVPGTFKFPAVVRYFGGAMGKRALSLFDQVLVIDDDIDVTDGPRGLWRVMAHWCVCQFRCISFESNYIVWLCSARAGMEICQPALTPTSSVNYAITQQVPQDGSPTARYTRFVEQMAPVFSRRALTQMLPYFRGLTHAWGIDLLWSDLLDREGRKMGIIDAVTIEHRRPMGTSPLYTRVGGISKAQADQAQFVRDYDIRSSIVDQLDASYLAAGETTTLTPIDDPKL